MPVEKLSVVELDGVGTGAEELSVVELVTGVEELSVVELDGVGTGAEELSVVELDGVGAGAEVLDVVVDDSEVLVDVVVDCDNNCGGTKSSMFQ